MVIGGLSLLKILRILLAILTGSFALYGMLADDFTYVPLMLLFMGGMILIMGIEEYKNNKKVLASLLIAVCLFIFYTSFETMLRW
ncbi:hypothetical protein AF331_11845 [Rossellomorea marisflavi]|uniref:DUF3953 domain-containing protein n=1 Tax=Rossellomorea marisflavi TaxID=189381 RepID=A0A0M0G599_9BACI|nr:hypothetical protein AF331_11845 [Rossellomorea marisflavi]